MLTIATLFWGMGFAWAKNVGEAANNSANMPQGSSLGPMLMLAIRFLAAAVLWAAVFPQSLRGWTWPSVRRGLLIGVTMCAGVVPQHLGLDQSSEAVTAFLTNLTVVFVPLMVAIITFRLPTRRMFVACAVAFSGIYLLTGAKPTGLSAGEVLGVVCAVAFSVEVLLLNWLMPKDSIPRMTLMMFGVCAIVCAVIAVMSPGFGRIEMTRIATAPVVTQIALLTVLTTAVSFGLMTAFQPKVDPTRAAIIYLFEPVFASAFAWITEPDASMSRLSIFGAALIVLANIIIEMKLPVKLAAQPPDPVRGSAGPVDTNGDA